MEPCRRMAKVAPLRGSRGRAKEDGAGRAWGIRQMSNRGGTGCGERLHRGRYRGIRELALNGRKGAAGVIPYVSGGGDDPLPPRPRYSLLRSDRPSAASEGIRV